MSHIDHPTEARAWTSWSTSADQCKHGEHCEIQFNTMLYDIDDPEYPKEWVCDEEGAECTAFEPTTPETASQEVKDE